VNKKHLFLPFLLLLSLTTFLHLQADESGLEPLTRGNSTIFHYQSDQAVMTPSDYQEKTSEMRGVWVATVFNINMPLHTSESQYKAAYDALIDEMIDNNMNAILFQVRPQNDAFYTSDYAAYSRWLTGTEGESPGWDVMTYMIEKAHANNIEFHAWLNPYRVGNSALSKEHYLDTLHSDNFARQNPNLVVAGNQDSNGIYPYILNPGEPEVKTYINDVVEELMTLYAVDGIHFDDYFYPYSGIDTDLDTYETYKDENQSLDDFRVENVNDVIRTIKETVDHYNDTNNDTVKFGVSPFGIWASDQERPEGSNTSPNALSSLNDQFADTYRWVKEEWVHYINPQVYWAFNHTSAPYADVVDWWAEITRDTNVDLIIGHSIANAEQWQNDEIAAQLLYNQKHPEIKGSIMYSASFLNGDNMNYVRMNLWQNRPSQVFTTYALNNDVTYDLEGTFTDSHYQSDVMITFAETDNLYVSLNHGPFLPYTDTITLTQNQNHVVHYQIIDGTQTSTVKGFDVTIIKVNDHLPTITIEGEQVDDEFAIGAEVVMHADYPIEVAINFGSVGSFEPYSSPIQLENPGTYFIRARTLKDGVYSEEATKRVVIAANAEVMSPDIALEGDYDGWEYTSAVSVNFESDNTVYYRIHNGSRWTEFEPYDAPFTLSRSVTYTVEYYAVDQYGNTSETESERVRMNLPITEDNTHVIRNNDFITYYQKDEAITLPIYQEASEEVRAIWVSTVSNIDLPILTDETSYKAMIDHMFEVIKANQFNTVFFQVRPMNDAFYESDLAPYSRYVTGTEGVNPGFDVLNYVIEVAHQHDIELHAWLNPYRVATGTQSKEAQLGLLHEDNFAKQNPDLVIQDNNGALILNPGEPEVIAYLESVVNELLEKYNLDGIHFDDYFYSYSGMNDTQDLAAFNQHNLEGLSLDDWRRENVNTLVKTVFNNVESYNTTNNQWVKFGISPFGIWASDQQIEGGSNTSPNALSSYYAQYADSKKWVEEGWLHYILPQLYWEFEHSVAPYADLVKWWSNLTNDSDVDLIIGHGFYRYADGTWNDPSELLEQLRYNQHYEAIIGSSFFTYNTLNQQNTNVVNALERLKTSYWTDFIPTPWETTVFDEHPACDEGEVIIDGECKLVSESEPDNLLVVYISGAILAGLIIGTVLIYRGKKR